MITPIIGKEFGPAIMPLIQAAKNSIEIIAYDWRWYIADPANPVQLFNQALVSCVRKNIKIRAVLNKFDICGILKSVGIQAKKKHYSKMLHAKIILIDDDITILGSHNLTLSAFQFNSECSLIIQDREINQRFKKFFEELWL
jgi:phosphatidylserine/phosphatidylglycerophosphate/cardiolipin synthase-like enzyme